MTEGRIQKPIDEISHDEVFDEYNDQERAYLDRLAELSREADRLELELAFSSENTKQLRQQHAEKIEEIRAITRAGADNYYEEYQAKAEWRLIPIGEAIPSIYNGEKLTKAGEFLIHELGLTTFGQFEDLRAGKHSEYPKGLIDVPGVGVSTMTKWEDDAITAMANASE